MEKRLVIYDNKLNNFGLRNFLPHEQNLFWALIMKVIDREGDTIKISRKEIEELSKYKAKNYKATTWEDSMESMGSKVIKLNTTLKNEKGGTVLFVCFPVFEINDDGIEIEVSRYFQPWFNNFAGKQYTKFELKKMIGLRSGYAKELFRFLMQYKSSGYWEVSVEKFRELLCIPKSYKWAMVEKQIIYPALSELTSDANPIFEYLEYFKNKKGRVTESIKFEFKAVSENKQYNGNKKEYASVKAGKMENPPKPTTRKTQKKETHEEELQRKIDSGEIDW
ncbi:MAG: replication initiation protein [Oscillospiraceae bacterium]|nr:replication initiation protein [Oscillospiraceae bacterium]